jgi:hypothetical protein
MSVVPKEVLEQLRHEREIVRGWVAWKVANWKAMTEASAARKRIRGKARPPKA